MYVSDLKDEEISAMLELGFRLPKPRATCNDFYYGIMQLCWNKDESKRPTFKELERKLNHTLEFPVYGEVKEIPIQLRE
jgi:hypothetical protein